MGFCTREQYRRFLQQAPAFERLLVDDGIMLRKYWFSVSDVEQERRFRSRRDDPMRHWKLSPMDVQSIARWEDYSRAKDEMFVQTDTAEAPWYTVESDDKKSARINMISHLLSTVPYEKLPIPVVPIPDRPPSTGYIRPPREENQYVPFDPAQGLVPLVVPGQHELAQSLPWGGTSHPVWFKRDPRVSTCKAQGGVFNAALMHGVPVIVSDALEATKDMTPTERDAALDAVAAQVMNSMPPRENPRLNKSLDSVHASGPLGRAHVVIHGNSNYQQTGLLQAYAAYSLLQQPPRRVGLASGCQAFGHRELEGVLRSFGFISPPVVTVQQ
jgi:hypothetical protein